MASADRRREFLTWAGAGVLLAACGKDRSAKDTPSADTEPGARSASRSEGQSASASAKAAEAPPEDVGAVEDLMREHGVIRRVLVIYREAAIRLATKPKDVSPEALGNAARLLRNFGEDYHEKKLEEAHIFPAVSAARPDLANTVKTLIQQHDRGREITDYVIRVTRTAIGPNAEALAQMLQSFARMYELHTAMEDTIVFPAWKKALSPKDLDAMGDRFETIEHDTLGEDGFENGVKEVAAIETSLGIDLGGLAAVAPPTP